MIQPQTSTRRRVMAATAAVAFLVAFVIQVRATERFDHKVRNDFFAGFTGDKEALERAMKTCEQILEENPKAAEALVWHGAGLYMRSGQAMRAGDREKGRALYERALGEMDRAVEIAPDSVGVRIPRGASLMTGARFMPPEMAKPLLERSISDYEHSLELQKGVLASMGEHPKGELLMGLGDAHSRLGNQEKAAMYFARIAKEMPGTPYAERAAIWTEKKMLTPNQAACIGCHVK